MLSVKRTTHKMQSFTITCECKNAIEVVSPNFGKYAVDCSACGDRFEMEPAFRKISLPKSTQQNLELMPPKEGGTRVVLDEGPDADEGPDDLAS